MSSERKRLANQRNAQKSTGPKTEEGKAKSRRNALKHGLRGAGVVLRRQDEQKLAKRIDDWRETLAPVSPLEDTLVERAALAAVRCESAVRQEAAERRRRVVKALSRFECKKRKEIEQAVALLASQPGCAGRKLKELKRGVAWLMGEWKKLADQLEGQGYWCHQNAGLALRLLGKDPLLPYPDHAEVLAFRKAFLAVLPELDVEEAEAILGLSGEGLDDPARQQAINAALPEPAEARKFLGKIVAKELKRLERRRAELEADRGEALERADAVELVQVGTNTHEYRLHRYECAQEMSLHRNLNELIRIRKQEPELASIARWEKQGKKYNRRWDGYQWVPNAEWQVSEDGEEPKRMTDGGCQMTEQTARPAGRCEMRGQAADSGSVPVSHQPSVISHPGASPAVWPGLSEACSGVLPTEPRLEEASGLQPEGPVTASGGSLAQVWPGLSGACPGLLANHPGLEEAAGLVAQELVTASGGSLCSTPGTRSESHPEAEEADLPAVDEVKVSRASLCSAPGTRPVADERADSLQSQASTRAAGFSALREPGAAKQKQEPVRGLLANEPATAAGASPDGLAPATPTAMTVGRWLTPGQTGRTCGKPEIAEQASNAGSAPLSHPSFVISHSPSSPVSPPAQTATTNEATDATATASLPGTCGEVPGSLRDGSRAPQAMHTTGEPGALGVADRDGIQPTGDTRPAAAANVGEENMSVSPGDVAMVNGGLGPVVRSVCGQGAGQGGLIVGDI